MSALINSLGVWWSGISTREQRLVIVCSVLILFGGVYWGLIQPMNERAEQAYTRINSEKQLLGWVQDKANDIAELRGAGGGPISSAPLNQVVSSSSKQYRIDLLRIQPRNESLQVWLKPVAFEQLINWLAYLKQNQGVDVEFMDLSATKTSGVVEVKRLQLKRGI